MTDDQEREDALGLESADAANAESGTAAEAPGSVSSESQGLPESKMQEQESSETAGSEDAAGDTESEAGESAEETGAAEPAGEPEVKPESRFGRFIKRALRWIALLVVVFALGVLAMEFVRVQPQRDEIAGLSQSLETAEATQAELQSEVDRLEGVEAVNEELADSLVVAGARLAILEIRLEVAQAQLALASEDMVGVVAALQGTGEKLMDLRDFLGEPKAAEIEELRERLILALSEVDSDPFAAERDLEVLANKLLELDRDLFQP